MSTIQLEGSIVDAAEIAGPAQNRSTEKQIEYWAKVGRIAQDNPDWNFEMIEGILQGLSEIEAGDLEPYE